MLIVTCAWLYIYIYIYSLFCLFVYIFVYKTQPKQPYPPCRTSKEGSVLKLTVRKNLPGLRAHHSTSEDSTLVSGVCMLVVCLVGCLFAWFRFVCNQTKKQSNNQTLQQTNNQTTHQSNSRQSHEKIARANHACRDALRLR